MKPVTEDQVQKLMDGLERREKAAMGRLERKTAEIAQARGRFTARVLSLPTSNRSAKASHSGDVIEMKAERNARRRLVSSKGFYFYSSKEQAARS